MNGHPSIRHQNQMLSFLVKRTFFRLFYHVHNSLAHTGNVKFHSSKNRITSYIHVYLLLLAVQLLELLSLSVVAGR